MWAIKIKWVGRAHLRCRYLIERSTYQALSTSGDLRVRINHTTRAKSLIQVGLTTPPATRLLLQRLPLCQIDILIEPRPPQLRLPWPNPAVRWYPRQAEPVRWVRWLLKAQLLPSCKSNIWPQRLKMDIVRDRIE
jgi:hypothetical protein